MTTDQQIHDAIDEDGLPPLLPGEDEQLRRTNSPGPVAGWTFIACGLLLIYLVFAAGEPTQAQGPTVPPAPVRAVHGVTWDARTKTITITDLVSADTEVCIAGNGQTVCRLPQVWQVLGAGR